MLAIFGEKEQSNDNAILFATCKNFLFVIRCCGMMKLRRFDMKNKIYLITGAGGGIGSAIARKIAQSIEKGTLLLHYNTNKNSVKALQK